MSAYEGLRQNTRPRLATETTSSLRPVADADARAATARSFPDWLRGELRSRRMSQRQLASRSGVDHATVSRLVSGTSEPNLATAMKLARGLRGLDREGDAEPFGGLFAALGSANPATRVERALRADSVLDDQAVRAIMQCYHAVRERSRRSA